MHATSFDESNGYLGPPPGMTPEEVFSLSVFRGIDAENRSVVISCWKLTKEELEEVNRTGRVWLGVLGYTMPPVWVEGLSPFRGPEDDS